MDRGEGGEEEGGFMIVDVQLHVSCFILFVNSRETTQRHFSFLIFLSYFSPLEPRKYSSKKSKGIDNWKKNQTRRIETERGERARKRKREGGGRGGGG